MRKLIMFGVVAALLAVGVGRVFANCGHCSGDKAKAGCASTNACDKASCEGKDKGKCHDEGKKGEAEEAKQGEQPATGAEAAPKSE